MKGTVHVTGNGTPQPRPGGGGTGRRRPRRRPNDAVAPELGVAIISQAKQAVRRSRALRAAGLARTRAATSGSARSRARGPAAKLVTVATGSVHMTRRRDAAACGSA